MSQKIIEPKSVEELQKPAAENPGPEQKTEPIIYRNHFTYVVRNLMGLIVVLLIIFVRDPRGTIEIFGEIMASSWAELPLLLGLAGVILVVGIFVFIQFRRWRKTCIIIDGTNLIVHQATLVQRDYVLAMENISSLNQEQKLWQMAFGVYTLRIDTNSTATAEEADVSIILNREKTQEFRKLVEERMSGPKTAVQGTTSAPSAQPVAEREEKPVTYLYSDEIGEEAGEDFWDVVYSPKETVIHAALATGIRGIFLAAVAVGASFIMSDELNLSWNGGFDVLISAIVIIVALWAVIGGAVKKYLLYCNFRAKRQGNHVLLSYGLTTTRRFQVPVDKINQVQIKQSSIARILGMQEVNISAIGMGDDDDEIKNVLLYGTKQTIAKNLQIILPEFMPYYEGTIVKKAKPVRRLVLAETVLVLIVLCGLVMALLPEEMIVRIASCAGMVVLVLFAAILSNRTAGLYVGETGVTVRSGIFGITDTLVGYDRIQSVEYTDGPLLRKVGMAKGTIHLFGGLLESSVGVAAFSKEYFQRIAEKTVATDGFK